MTRTTMGRLLAASVAFTGCFSPLSLPRAHSASSWIRQFGSTDNDGGAGIDVDASGNVYLTGETWGSFAGPSLGSTDVFIAKFDPSGERLWASQYGTAQNDDAADIATTEEGGFYLSGGTYGNLAGPLTSHFNDAFVSKFDPAGNPQWARQFGDVFYITGNGVAADGQGNVYVVGHASDLSYWEGYVRKYDATGSLLWTRRPVGRGVSDIALDEQGNAYVAGVETGGSFLTKYNPDGNVQWTQQLGEAASQAISWDALGNVFVCGYTWGDLAAPNAGERDAFVAKYDAEGMLQWTRQFGSSAEEEVLGVSVDSQGNAYIAGFTRGSLARPVRGDSDAFIAKYDAAGALQAIRQFGTAASDGCVDVHVDALDNVYVTGSTRGELGGPLIGRSDAFLARFPASLVPEPATRTLVLLVTWIGARPYRRSRRRGR
jgi:hypothetical protein